MNKPISIAIHDFKESLIDLINNSGIPFSIMSEIINNFQREVNEASKLEYEKAKNEYDKQQNAEEAPVL